MWEWAEPAETRAKPAIVSKHNMATRLMGVIFMAFTSLRNLRLSYPAAGITSQAELSFWGTEMQSAVAYSTTNLRRPRRIAVELRIAIDRLHFQSA